MAKSPAGKRRLLLVLLIIAAGLVAVRSVRRKQLPPTPPAPRPAPVAERAPVARTEPAAPPSPEPVEVEPEPVVPAVAEQPVEPATVLEPESVDEPETVGPVAVVESVSVAEPDAVGVPVTVAEPEPDVDVLAERAPADLTEPPPPPPPPAATRPGPFPGSVLPLGDGSAPSGEYLVKGNANSMRSHGPSSPYYGRTRAEVWFRTERDAVAAGFRPYGSKNA